MPAPVRQLKRWWNTKPNFDPNDIIGKKFNKLTILKYQYHDKKSRKYYYLCLCDCGNKKIILRNSILKNHTKSCGCLQKKAITKPPTIAAFNALYGIYKRLAKQRNLSFNLTKKDFKKLTKSNCYYCNTAPNRKFNNGLKGTKQLNGYYLCNGIDRLNNYLGYKIDNCVACCDKCNKAKRTLTETEFKQMIIKIYNHYILKGDAYNVCAS